MASSRQSKNSPIGLPPTDTLSVDISNWVYNGAIAENSQLKQVVEQQQQELTDKTQAQEQLVKKTRLLEKKLDEEVERARVAKRKLDVAEAKIVEKENTAQTLRKGLEASQAAVVASNEAYEEAMSKTSALRQQLVETKAELSSAQATLDESKTMTQTELDAAKSECEEVRQALETAKAENVAKQSEISKLSELNDRYAARLEVYAQSYARAKDIFDTLGQLHMLSGREAVTGGGAERNVIVAGVSPAAVKSAVAIDNVPTGSGNEENAVAGPSTPTVRAPSKRKHDDDDDDEEMIIVSQPGQPGVEVRIRNGIARPATRKSKKNRAGSATDEEVGKTVGANVPLVPLPTTPARNDPPTFESSRNSARTKRRSSVNKDPLVEISLDTNTDQTDSKPDIATKTLPPYDPDDPDDLDDICLMPTPDSYGVEKIPPEWSSPSDRKTPLRTSANSRRLRDIPSSGSVKKRTLRMGSVVGNARGALQGDNDDDDDPINL